MTDRRAIIAARSLIRSRKIVTLLVCAAFVVSFGASALSYAARKRVHVEAPRFVNEARP